MKEIGLNLYSLRTFLASEESFLDTALKLKDMGYTFLQYSGGKFDAEMIARVSRESGLPVILTHAPKDRIFDDTDALMEEHALFGCKNIGLGMVSTSVVTDPVAFVKEVDRLEAVAEKMNAAGFSFYYHNHHHELVKHGDVTALEYMLVNAPHLNFTLDTYWIQYGGGDIADYIEKMSGRIGCVHLKDYKVSVSVDEKGKTSCTPKFAPVGQGNLNFPKLVELMKKAGTQYFIVEQDNAVTFDDPFAQVGASVKYIKEVL